MTLLNDKEILDAHKSMRKNGCKGMIEGIVSRQVRERSSGRKIISYGLSSFGYDIRLDKFIYVPKKRSMPHILDPKAQAGTVNRADIWDYKKIERDGYEIPPHGFVLANSIERFNIPDDILAVCVGKSTYARCGIVVNVTPLEPGWQGFLTLEISNTTDFAVKIYANEGIAQLLFYRGERPSVTYADRSGKYQNQPNKPVLPML